MPSRSVKLDAVMVFGSIDRVKVARTAVAGLTPVAPSSGTVSEMSGGGGASVVNCHEYAVPSGAPSAALSDDASVAV